MIKIRKVRPTDLPDLKMVLNSIDLFPASMLDDMISDFLNNLASEEIWFTATQNDQPVSIAYCAPEQLTEGTYNLYAIGVAQTLQGKGIGGQMLTYLEDYLRSLGARILIVETSGTPAFDQTRAFYKKREYTQEATIRDFWKQGDDKVIYWKRL